MEISGDSAFITLRDVFQVITWPTCCSSTALLQLPEATATTLPLLFHETQTTGNGEDGS
jgi:hypothetical protein